MLNVMVKLRETHLRLFRDYLTFALVNVALGGNFFFFPPAFNPYEWPEWLIGGIFLTLGLVQLLVIFKFPKLWLIRVSVGVDMGWVIVWGASTVMSFPDTSLQLPILYLAYVLYKAWHLLEPFINPTTANGKKPNGHI